MKVLDESVIPKGLYCYTISEIVNDRIVKTNICPYLRNVHNKPEQMNGFCLYLDKGDWQEYGTDLLWDMVKECGVNEDIDFDEDLQFKYE